MPTEDFGKADTFEVKLANAQYLKSNKSSAGKGNSEEEESEGISAEALKCYIKAGEISKKVKEYMKEIIKKDVLLVEIADKIEAKIKELGGDMAFPTNISIDEIAAHYTPTARDETKASGLFKVDIGVEVGGYIADTAVSFDLTDDKRYTEMIKINNEALEAALKELKVGSPMKVIGNTISSIVEAHVSVSPDGQKAGRFKVIRNLTGHGLEKDDIHAGDTVSNLKNENEMELADMAIAIEPFLTEGRGEIFEGKPSEIFVIQNKKTPRDRDARIMLDYILKNYKTKPFCKRWLERAGLPKPNYCLSLLVKEGIVYNFPVLVEKERKPVSQAEHTVVFADKVYVTTM
ncbi:MAG: type II methionyl aminopeptidase [archaeon]